LRHLDAKATTSSTPGLDDIESSGLDDNESSRPSFRPSFKLKFSLGQLTPKCAS